MFLRCGICNTQNDVIEVHELKDITNFKERRLLIGKCKRCSANLAMLVETRMHDNKVFIDRFVNEEAKKVIKRESKRLRYKQYFNNRNDFQGWVYGLNVERKNKKNEVTGIKQYSCDFKTGSKKLEKAINSR